MSPRREPPPVPLLVLLLPALLDRMPDREPIDALLELPVAVAIEPPRVSYRALARLPADGGFSIARRQVRRMKLPGVPAVVAMLHPHQYPLAAALLAGRPRAELWYAPPSEPPADAREAELHAAATEHAAARLVLPLSAPLLARMESLGVESGRLGSERLQP